MSSNLIIKRLPVDPDNGRDEISLEEWINIVNETDGIRLFTGKEHIVVNKVEDVTISFPPKDGDCEVYFPADDTWIFVFRWYRGTIHFKDNVNFSDNSDPVMKTVKILINKLNAVIQTEYGEIIDITTGGNLNGC